MSDEQQNAGGASHEGRLVSIGDLSRAVGIPVETLRTWERRYGVPVAVRLPSGHRRYALDALPRLRRVADLIRAGHRASSVLALDERELDSLVGSGGGVAAADATAAETGPLDEGGGGDPWLAAALDLDGVRIDRLLQHAWSSAGPIRAMDETLGPMLAQLGELWRRGEISVGHEHFVSERVQGFLSERWREASARAGGPLVVCTSLPGEHHVLGVHMAAAAAASAGLRVMFLGRDTPLGSIREITTTARAHAVLLSVSAASDTSTARALLERLADELPNDVELLAGGAGAPAEANGVRIFRSVAALHEWAAKQR